MFLETSIKEVQLGKAVKFCEASKICRPRDSDRLYVYGIFLKNKTVFIRQNVANDSSNLGCVKKGGI